MQLHAGRRCIRARHVATVLACGNCRHLWGEEIDGSEEADESVEWFRRSRRGAPLAPSGETCSGEHLDTWSNQSGVQNLKLNKQRLVLDVYRNR